MAASRTAEFVAMYRALETTEPARQPLFLDPFAERFLPPVPRTALRLAQVGLLRSALVHYADWRAPGARTSAIGRTRFIDDLVVREAGVGTDQLVILGAGYDCRAHRLPQLSKVRVFEVDRADTQAEKRGRLAGAEHSAPAARDDVTYVAVDFTRDVLSTRLLEAGWSSDRASIFLWEGVTNYLDAAAVDAVLQFVGTTAPGSVLVFTYIHRGVLDGTAHFFGADQLVRNVQRLGEPWKFGLLPDEVDAYVARFGFTLEQNLGADEYRQLYFPDQASELRGYAFYRVAVARVAGAGAHAEA